MQFIAFRALISFGIWMLQRNKRHINWPSTHTHPIRERKRLRSNIRIIEILRTVPFEKGFHFYTAHGSYTGETATSLDDFEKKIQVVAAESISFHSQRGDFQKWIEDTLGDEELAKRIGLLRITLAVEDLRKELLAIVQARVTELRWELPHHLGHTHA
jgi:hypothetical protein